MKEMTGRINRNVAYDCQYFLSDRPCIWHKQEGLICECEHYIPLKQSLLIIKLDAMGDVLRTTCLLPAIAKAWPGIRITWITRNDSVPLLENNPYVTEIIPYGTDAIVHLTSRYFDHVINLDAGKISSGMASIANAKETIGYIMHENGYVTAANNAAEEWLQMGVFDDMKRANRRTYQEIMCSILGLPPEGLKYVLELTEAEKEKGRSQLLNMGVDLNKKVIGIHTGGGGRWVLKQWREEGFISLIMDLVHELKDKIQIVLFGGPLERELNKRVIEKVKVSVFDAGCDNEVRHFAAMINCCSVVLSGDSLAMHIAISQGSRVVILFGPTSSAEIELFGSGEKIVPDLECLSCYKKVCALVPNCMDLITVDAVKQAIVRQLGYITRS